MTVKNLEELYEALDFEEYNTIVLGDVFYSDVIKRDINVDINFNIVNYEKLFSKVKEHNRLTDNDLLDMNFEDIDTLVDDTLTNVQFDDDFHYQDWGLELVAINW